MNLSVFQSLLDSWGIDQVFPIMPIHRLERRADASWGAGRHHLRLGRAGRPFSRATVSPKTNPRAPRGAVRWSVAAGRARRIRTISAIFLAGAYQETLGDLHNLLGDTNAVHVRRGVRTAAGASRTVVEGETVRDVLSATCSSSRRRCGGRLRGTMSRRRHRGRARSHPSPKEREPASIPRREPPGLHLSGVACAGRSSPGRPPVGRECRGFRLGSPFLALFLQQSVITEKDGEPDSPSPEIAHPHHRRELSHEHAQTQLERARSARRARRRWLRRARARRSAPTT